MKEIVKLGGTAFIIAGIFLIITNTLFTPFIDFKASFSEITSTQIFLYRMICAAITAFFLLLATTGLYIFQRQNNYKSNFIFYLLAFAGSAFLFSNEWYQIFVIPELAKISPDAIDNLDSSSDFSGYDIGALLAITTFTLGWLLLSISMLRSKLMPKLIPTLVISGFFLIPILSALIPVTIAGAIGNAVLGIGFILLGREILRKGIVTP